MIQENNKVSIITAVYNSENYIRDTILSVQAQTYSDWEMIIVDDASTDHTADIVAEFAEKDKRIILIKQKSNIGAGAARTLAVKQAKGRYIAYLDADDLWYPEKLEKQIIFMRDKGCGFSCTSYEVINDVGEPLKKYVYMLPKVNYKEYLTNNLLQTVGIMADLSIVPIENLYMPDLRRRQDVATWLQVLKTGNSCFGMQEILAKYRRTKQSLSSNKIKAVKGMWYLYREVEHLPLFSCCYCFVRYAFLAIWKRIYIGGHQS